DTHDFRPLNGRIATHLSTLECSATIATATARACRYNRHTSGFAHAGPQRTAFTCAQRQCSGIACKRWWCAATIGDSICHGGLLLVAASSFLQTDRNEPQPLRTPRQPKSVYATADCFWSLHPASCK